MTAPAPTPVWRDWTARVETDVETLSPEPSVRLAATLDQPELAPATGQPLPALWHWLHFLPKEPQSQLAHDGHAKRGGFLPPVDLPRRMYAGGRFRFLAPLTVGDTVERSAEVLSITEKTGGTGRLVFVCVRYRLQCGGVVCVEEEQDLVYLEAGPPIPAPVPTDPLPAAEPGEAWRRAAPDAVMLFRFSALTFNGHRIHYDRDYVTKEEGYPGIVVHGPLTALMLCELARETAGRAPSSYAFRGRAPLFDGQPILLAGRTLEDASITLRAVRCDGTVAMTAEARFDV